MLYCTTDLCQLTAEKQKSDRQIYDRSAYKLSTHGTHRHHRYWWRWWNNTVGFRSDSDADEGRLQSVDADSISPQPQRTATLCDRGLIATSSICWQSVVCPAVCHCVAGFAFSLSLTLSDWLTDCLYLSLAILLYTLLLMKLHSIVQ